MQIAELEIKDDLTAEKEDEIELFLTEHKGQSSWLTIEVRSNVDDIKDSLLSLKDLVNLAAVALINCNLKIVTAVENRNDYENPKRIIIRFYNSEPIINNDLILA